MLQASGFAWHPVTPARNGARVACSFVLQSLVACEIGERRQPVKGNVNKSLDHGARGDNAQRTGAGTGTLDGLKLANVCGIAGEASTRAQAVR